MGQIQEKCSCLSNENNCFRSNINLDAESEENSSNGKRETNPFISLIFKPPKTKQTGVNIPARESQKLPRKKTFNIYRMIQSIQKKFKEFKLKKEFNNKLKPILVKNTLDMIEKLERDFKNDKISQVEQRNKPYEKDGWKKFYDKDKYFNVDYNDVIIENSLRIFNDKAYYNGQTNLLGEMHGYGVYREKDGILKQGHWRNNNFTGWGRIIDSKGTILEGRFIKGVLSGKGVRISSNSHYEGDFLDGLRHGYGTDNTKEHKYTGDYKWDKKNGKGNIYFINTKESYEGEFQKNCITGVGRYTWANKDTFEGTFFNGKMNGKGLYKWVDGGEYYGDYVNGLKEGTGKFKWSDGKTFEGPFVKGKPHGLGKLYDINNSVSEVEFDGGRIVNNSKIKNSFLKLKKTYTSTTGNIFEEENL
jgi:hypothetical protein